MTTTMKLTEHPDPVALREASHHPDVWPDDRKRLARFAALVQAGSVPVSYTRPHGARLKPTHLGRDVMNATQMWKRVRSAVYGRTEDDVDIANCHPRIAAALSTLVGLDPSSVNTILAYAKDRDAELAKQQLAREDAKTLVVACLNGLNIHRLERSDSAAIKEFIAKNPDWEPCDWWTALHSECAVLRSMLTQSPPVREVLSSMGDAVSDSNKVAMVMMYVESEHMLGAKAELESRGVAWTVYAYDGFQTSKRNRAAIDRWLSDGCPVVQTDNQLFPDHNWGRTLQFVVKPWAQPLEPHPHRFDHGRFRALCQEGGLPGAFGYFEAHFFALDTGVLAQQTGRDSYVFHKNNGQNNKRLAVKVRLPSKNGTGTDDVPFLKLWYNSHFRAFENICYSPPGGRQDPSNAGCYNMWSGWQIESVRADGGDHSEGIACLNGHLKYLMENSDEGLAYVRKWLAHVFQKPGSPTGALLAFLSEQGAGKTSFFQHLMNALMGSGKVLITQDANLLTGRFNVRAGKHFLGLDEASGKDTVMNASQWKAIITEDFTSQERKGIDAVQLPAVGNFAVFTNSIGNSICVERGDRRYVVCQLGPVKGKAYYDRLFALIDESNPAYDPQVVRAFYDGLMAEDLSGFHPQRDRYISDTHRRFQEANVSPIERWIDHSRVEPTHRMRGLANEPFAKTKDLYLDFAGFCEDELRTAHDKVMNQTSFSLKLGNLVKRGSGVSGLTQARDRHAKGYKVSPAFFTQLEMLSDSDDGD